MDYHIDKSKSFGPRQPYMYDVRSKYTSISSKSPRVNGKLVLRENPYEVLFFEKKGTTCNWGVSWDNEYPAEIDGFDSNPTIHPELEDLESQARKQATEKAYAKVANVQMSLAETILERASTIKVFIERAKQIKNLYDALKNGKLPPIPSKYKGKKKAAAKAAAANKDISALWLEYSFMWMPILSDIKLLLDGIKPIEGVYVRGKAVVSGSKYVHSTWPMNGGARTTSVFSTRTVSATVKLWVTIDDPLVALQSEMGFLTPVSVWNVLPFSFVVDWFFRIGALFERLCFPGKTITQGSTTTKIEDSAYSFASLSGLYWVTDEYPPRNIYYTSKGSGINRKTVLYKRVLGVPSPFFITTNFQNMSWWTVGTTWALLTTLFSKKS